MSAAADTLKDPKTYSIDTFTTVNLHSPINNMLSHSEDRDLHLTSVYRRTQTKENEP